MTCCVYNIVPRNYFRRAFRWWYISMNKTIDFTRIESSCSAIGYSLRFDAHMPRGGHGRDAGALPMKYLLSHSIPLYAYHIARHDNTDARITSPLWMLRQLLRWFHWSKCERYINRFIYDRVNVTSKFRHIYGDSTRSSASSNGIYDAKLPLMFRHKFARTSLTTCAAEDEMQGV